MCTRFLYPISDFPDFLPDFSISIIIGAAFGKIVSSLVEDIVLPPITWITGKISFADMFVSLSGGDYATLAEAKKAGATTINYGLFINNVISFLIVAVCVLFMVKYINQLKRNEDVDAIAPSQKNCPFCCSSITIKAVKCSHCTADIADSIDNHV